jgi:hypothetical protein
MSKSTTDQRQLILKGLKAARHFVSKTYRNGGKEQFICHALIQVQHRGGKWAAPALLASALIMERVTRDHFCIEAWLRHHIGEDAFYAASAADPDCVQKYRHRWLDALIEEFSHPA